MVKQTSLEEHLQFLLWDSYLVWTRGGAHEDRGKMGLPRG